MKKKYLIIISLIIFLIPLILIVSKLNDVGNFPKYQKKIWSKAFRIYMEMPDFIKSSLMIVSGKRNFSNLFNDYNVKFLPQTQYLELDFIKKKINFDNDTRFSFYIEIYNNNLFLVTKKGKFYRSNLSDLIVKNKNLNIEEFKVSNLSRADEKNVKILDTLVVGSKLFVSKISNYQNCKRLEIMFANIKDDLRFNTFKLFEECASISIGAGRIAKFNFNGQDGILLTTNDSDNDMPGNKAQSDNSIFGKIVFINLNSKQSEIFSKGHRNSQGLAVMNNIILSTEHGPRGGDELNRIYYNKNYGWPIASYGNSYKDKNLTYKKSHYKNSFEEPLFVFLPSIGISELIFLPNKFDDKWYENILVSSLNGRSIFRIKFESSNFKKVLYNEKIYIGERIRDIKYVDKYNLIILALERTGSLGILKKLD